MSLRCIVLGPPLIHGYLLIQYPPPSLTCEMRPDPGGSFVELEGGSGLRESAGCLLDRRHAAADNNIKRNNKQKSPRAKLGLEV
jgi:hypothetical protein